MNQSFNRLWALAQGKSNMSVNKAKFDELKKRIPLNVVIRIRLNRVLSGAENHQEWLMNMKADLRSYGLLPFIENTFDEKLMEEEDFIYYHELVKEQILLNVSAELSQLIKKTKTAKEIWEKLSNLVLGTGFVRAMKLFQKVELIQEDKKAPIEKWSERMRKVMDEFNGCWPDTPSDLMLGLALKSIPKDHKSTRSLLLAKKNLKMNDVFNQIYSESQFEEDENKSKLVSSCKLTVEKTELKCSICDSKDHLWRKCPRVEKHLKSQKQRKGKGGKDKNKDHQESQQSQEAKGKSLVKNCCLIVHQEEYTPGIWQEEEIIEEDDLSVELSTENQVHNETVTQSREIVLSNAMTSAESSDQLQHDATYLDSGAVRHLRNNTRSCSRLYKGVEVQVQTADNSKLNTEGIGSFEFTTETGHLVKFNDVILCTKLAASFISVGVLDEQGYEIKFKSGRVMVLDEGELFLTGIKVQNGMYKLILNEVKTIRICTISLSVSEAYNWHRRLNHVNFADLHKIKERLNIKMANVNQIRCEDCLVSKAKRLPFEQSEIKSTAPLELIHTDLSGITRVKNVIGVNYFLHFTDDYTRFRVVYLLESKTQVKQAYEEYRDWIELQLDRKIKKWRSDNGTEFKNTCMYELLKGVETQYTIPDSPASNGVAERGMGVIQETVRVMLESSKLSDKYWPQAVRYAVHVKNRLPCSAINFQIPYEKMFKRKVDFNRLHTFGAKVVAAHQETENKFSPTGRRGVFVGISDEHKAYEILFEDTGEIKPCRDVHFMDNRFIPSTTSRELFNCYPDESTDLEEEDAENGEVSTTNDSTSVDQEENESPESREEVSAEASNSDESSNEYPKGKITMDANEEIEFRRMHPNAVLEHYRPIYSGKNYKGPKKNIWLVNCLTVPKSYPQAQKSKDWKLWHEAMKAEYLQLLSMKAWKLVDRPKGQKVLPVIWIYTVKTDRFGAIERYKARACILGNQQEEQSTELYAPVINSFSIKILLSLAVQFGYKVRHLDIKCAYLNAPISQQVYTEQLKGFEAEKGKVLQWNSAMYGLRTSALDFFKKLRSTFYKCELLSITSDECIYLVKDEEKASLIVGSHVDDLIVLYREEDVFNKFYNRFNSLIETKDNGPVSYFLGMEIDRKEDGMYISQRKYAINLLQQFGFTDCKPVPTPMSTICKFDENAEKFEDIHWYQSAVGALLYLTNTRPDLSYVVGLLCRFISQPTVEHVNLVKRVFRYVRGTLNYALKYTANGVKRVQVYTNDPKNAGNAVTAFADADFANEIHGHKSVSGVMFFIGNNLINWISRRQNRCANSTTEAEILSIQEAVHDAEYAKNLLSELGYSKLYDKPAMLYNDNSGAKSTIDRGGSFGSNRHYRVRVNVIREAVRDGLVRIEHITGEEMRADMLTKALSKDRLRKLLKLSQMDIGQESV